MAAGVATAVVEKIEPAGGRTRSTGTIALSNDYQAGGDALDPSALGLATVERLFLALPGMADGSAVSALIFPLVRTLLPQRTSVFRGSGSIVIPAFTATAKEASGDLSAHLIPFEAYGV